MKKFITDNNITIKKGIISYIDPVTKGKVEKLCDIPLNKIHEKMQKINYTKVYDTYRNIHDETIEKYKMMPFAYAYYMYFVENLNIPTPNELVEKYFKLFCEKVNGDIYTFKKEYLIAGNNIQFKHKALAARILRSYNTFNREVEFMAQLMNSKEMTFTYDLAVDLFDGVDLVAEYNNKQIGIAEYINTKRSTGYKNAKNTNRHDYSKMPMVDVIAYFSGENKNVVSYGEIFCYSKETVDNTIKQIKEVAR